MGSMLSFTAEAESDSEPASYTPSEDDVYAVQKLLLSLLPFELIDIILDEAQYWPAIQAKNGTIGIAKSSGPDNHAAWCWIITPPLKPGKYRQVRFMTSSHDQGYGDPNQGSWTWFETVILRPGSAFSSVIPKDLDSSKDITRPYMKLLETEVDRWHICSNIPASGDGKTFFTVFSKDDDGLEARTDRIKGRMDDGKTFVDLLRPGDQIAVIARAMFPQWANHVYEVSVEVSYSL
ncbi:hypothetical protein C8J56DRAFT_951990 [Mycena floridula]|nr:hypothetical protein C8J56DRAFT_951990 [Mycena floridula]